MKWLTVPQMLPSKRRRCDSNLGSIAAALAAFVARLTGLSLQRFLPERHTSNRDMILAIVSLVSLLLALVLGIITGSAYNF